MTSGAKQQGVVRHVKAKIRKGDDVVVICGKHKGLRGEVLCVKRELGGQVRVRVSGVGLVKRHVKPNPQANEAGGIKTHESFIDLSNVKLFNPATKRGDRVGYRRLEDGKKVRYFKSTGDVVSVGK